MKTLVLVDISAVFWAAWHATVDQEIGSAFEITVSSVHRFIDGADYAAVCCDYPPYWRKEFLPTYKAQRDAPAQQALDQFRRVRMRLAADGLVLWENRGYEADDIIATAVECAKRDKMAVTVVSADKDLLQLVDTKNAIQVRSSSKPDDFYDDAAVEKKWAIPPRVMRDLLALTGDSSDNVPGIKGVGPKTAAAWILEWGSIDGVLANCDKLTPERFRPLVVAGADGIRLAYKLVGLRTDAQINFEDIYKPREVQPVTEQPYEKWHAEEEPADPASAPEVSAEPVETSKRLPETPVAPVAPVNGTPPQALALTPQPYELQLEPQSLGTAYKLAQGLANSRLYSRFPNAEAIWAVIIRGRELGLGALTSLDVFHIVEGKPCPNAHFIVARGKRHPDCEYFRFVSGDATYAEYETKHRQNPKPTTLRYTIDQARKVGLVKQGSNWEKRPDEMLRKTAAVQLVRIEYPEAAMGLYSTEEMGADA